MGFTACRRAPMQDRLSMLLGIGTIATGAAPQLFPRSRAPFGNTVIRPFRIYRSFLRELQAWRWASLFNDAYLHRSELSMRALVSLVVLDTSVRIQVVMSVWSYQPETLPVSDCWRVAMDAGETNRLSRNGGVTWQHGRPKC